MAALRNLRYKTRRLRRHLAALARYHTPRRLGNLLRVEFERIAKRETLRGRPYIIVLDPLNTCNLRCPLCPTGRRELPLKPGRMELDQFEFLVDSLAPWLFKIIL